MQRLGEVLKKTTGLQTGRIIVLGHCERITAGQTYLLANSKKAIMSFRL